MTYHARLIKGGKIVIPAELRREFGFNEGDDLVFEKVGDQLVLKSQDRLLRDIRARVKAGMKYPVSVDSIPSRKVGGNRQRMTFVLDASAVLALLLDEPGGDYVYTVAKGSEISVVNLSEVVATSRNRGKPLRRRRASSIRCHCGYGRSARAMLACSQTASTHPQIRPLARRSRLSGPGDVQRVADPHFGPAHGRGRAGARYRHPDDPLTWPSPSAPPRPPTCR